jgi:hypothetical protein
MGFFGGSPTTSTAPHRISVLNIARIALRLMLFLPAHRQDVVEVVLHLADRGRRPALHRIAYTAFGEFVKEQIFGFPARITERRPKSSADNGRPEAGEGIQTLNIQLGSSPWLKLKTFNLL